MDDNVDTDDTWWTSIGLQDTTDVHRQNRLVVDVGSYWSSRRSRRGHGGRFGVNCRRCPILSEDEARGAYIGPIQESPCGSIMWRWHESLAEGYCVAMRNYR